MDSLDRNLLTIIQNNFPVCARPFSMIGEQLDIDEEEVIARLKSLKAQGMIRRIGAIYDSKELGYKSTLCAMEVPEEKLEEVVNIVNRYVGVTHNYLRNHNYNLWFTLITSSQFILNKTLHHIEQQTGLKIHSLPAKRLFKIKVNFRVPAKGAKVHAK